MRNDKMERVKRLKTDDSAFKKAVRAFQLEQEYNERHKERSLMIKFPDLELNIDIVKNFDAAIGDVHFPEFPEARSCFVTLQETANAEEVMQNLNKTQFGTGFLKAEYRKDLEEEKISPKDLDPCALYIANFNKDVTEEVIKSVYTESERVEMIGPEEGKKCVPHAFVYFKNAEDAMEAFKNTYNCQVDYASVLFVRFRRKTDKTGKAGSSQDASSDWFEEFDQPSGSGT